MVIGVMSDIHGNIEALKVVLEEFKNKHVETILCGGDVIGLGPHPEETVKLLKSCNHIISVKGNHEGYFLDGIPDIIHGRPLKDVERNHHLWIHGELSNESKEYLATFQKEVFFQVNNKIIYMTHYPMEENGEYKPFSKVANEEELQNLFQDIKADIYLYGHTHMTNCKQIGQKWYINMGTLGCPLKENVAVAGVLEVNEEAISYEILNIPYRADSVRTEIAKMQYPFYDEVLRIFY